MLFYLAVAVMFLAWIWMGLCHVQVRPDDMAPNVKLFGVLGMAVAWAVFGVGALLLVLSTMPGN